jgi:tubby-related protein 1
MLASEEDEAVYVDTILPTWDEEVESLVLSFEGRTARASERNFKLTLAGPPLEGCAPDVLFQHVKLSDDMWCIDFKHPLSAVQAFGIALSSIKWE